MSIRRFWIPVLEGGANHMVAPGLHLTSTSTKHPDVPMAAS